MYLVYKLYDPRDQQKNPRYIGITASSLNKRLKEHLYRANHSHKNWHNYNWIRKLLLEGVSPEIEPVDFAKSHEEALEKEVNWIHTLKDKGHSLCNSSSGGDGGVPKRIKQFNISGEFIKLWSSIRQIEKELGLSNSHITSCCRGKYGRKTLGGFVWRYEDDDFNTHPLITDRSKQYKLTILQIDPDTLTLIKEWEHSQLIENELNICRPNINLCCRKPILNNGSLRKAGNYNWIYKKDEDIVRSLGKLKNTEEVDISQNSVKTIES